MDLYREARRSINDDNACVPTALAIVAGRDAGEVNATMVRDGARKPGRGVRQGVYFDWAERKLGLTFHKLDAEWKGVTVKSVTKHLDPTCSYLVSVPGHVLAVVGGEVQDWTNDRKHRVEAVHAVNSTGGNWKAPQRDTSRQDQLHALMGNHWALHHSGKNKLRAEGHDGYRRSSVYFELLTDGSIQIDLTEELAAAAWVVDMESGWVAKKGRYWLRTVDANVAREVLRGVLGS